MRTSTVLIGLACSMLTALSAVACGGSGDGLSDFDKEDQRAANPTGNGNGGGTIGGNTTPGSNPNPELEKCATQSAEAQPRPVYLVFQYDKSGSMGDDGKWNACKAATKAFFTAPDSAGIKASLTFFPTGGDICSTNQYKTPAVAVTALPSPAFGAALDSQSPNGGTPTKSALSGAIDYAKQVQAGEGKDGTVAIVLVTDGVPANCSDNSIGNVKALAASVAATIPTYVIGVGGALGSLNDIAVGGGTKSAFIVNTGDPSKTQTELLKAINAIKQNAISCDYKIPPAPAGETFDRSKVNVQVAPTGAAAATVGYNQACTGGTGWRYDDEKNPTRILLCDASCEQVKAKPGKVDIVFGCATQSGPVK
ncbi:MAG: VWA domain-containing protein [Deltaproteobacteria bacterium]|nr:VWA domain-containing protein [Deltaproteobacteria bacterium]